ncbi:NADPH-dependent FMN reductase [Alicyclobacillus sp. ALC3]|uniref:NADPH-dependent FMN reductase n=1 Tax=Alicyclobacillus sp. ALC3 TaxID=2796143 RepID=UPI002379124E|nr:NADPH-dependent FMN reductase [Alicyclobacillus sp. ALC3]WDL95498.1 NAD(P)H-dependent oxidoreductase [Alicyclobacillus sp. ALC3]
MEFAVLNGSLRSKSYNQALIDTMDERYRDKFQLKQLSMAQLPYFNQDQELNPPEVVQQFKGHLRMADAIVMATPEFNWSIPGILKNALDWASRGELVLVNKPALIVGASTGMIGTLRAQLHLRQVLSAPGLSCRTLPPGGNEVLVTFAEQKFDVSGRLTDPATLAFLDSVVEKFLAFI